MLDAMHRTPIIELSSNNPTRKDIIMNKLINAYRKMPSPTNRAKLQAYLDKHMMSICMATPEDVAFLKANEFKI